METELKVSSLARINVDQPRHAFGLASPTRWIAKWRFGVHNLAAWKSCARKKDPRVRQSLFGSRFLARLQATGLQHENPRVERVLAISRVLLGLTALIVDFIHPLAPEPYNQLLILLLMMYCVQNLGFLIWMIINPDVGKTFVRVMQASDVFWPIVLCLFADPPSSLVFVFFLFALMTTAYRFGVYETVLTAIGCTLVLILQESVVAIGPKELEPFAVHPAQCISHRIAMRIPDHGWIFVGISRRT